MINFSIGIGAGIIFSCIILAIVMWYGRRTSAWDTEKKVFENRMYEYWDTSMRRWNSQLNIQQTQHETICEILQELKRMNEIATEEKEA